MELTLRILTVIISTLGVMAAIYNITTARGYQKQVGETKKLEDAHAMGLSNKQSIENLTQRMDEREARTEKRLDQIGKDVADVKKLFTDFVIENLRAMTRH